MNGIAKKVIRVVPIRSYSFLRVLKACTNEKNVVSNYEFIFTSYYLELCVVSLKILIIFFKPPTLNKYVKHKRIVLWGPGVDSNTEMPH